MESRAYSTRIESIDITAAQYAYILVSLIKCLSLIKIVQTDK